MKLKRIVSKKTGAVGFRGRYTDRQTGKRIKRTVWIAERTDAETVFRGLQSSSGKREHNISDSAGWRVAYAELVKKFIAGCTVSAERRIQLRKFLEKNPLSLSVAGDICRRGVLNQKCKSIAATTNDIRVIKSIQQPLKQLSAWAAEAELIPYDPLKGWTRLSRELASPKKKAFTAEEVQAIFDAMDELDSLGQSLCPLSMVFKTFLITGNRPGALIEAKVGDFSSGAIELPPGGKTKRNGVCTVPPAFTADMQRYFMMRGRPSHKELLLVSQRGDPLNIPNLSKQFRRASTLAFVKLAWPARDPRTALATQLDVAQTLNGGKLIGFDGAKPTNEAKILARVRRAAAIEGLVELLKPSIEKRLDGRPMYALRHTHITWARRFVPYDAVRAQVGHAGRNIEEIHYNDEDFVDAGASSLAVWEVLKGIKSLERNQNQNTVLTKVVGEVAPNAAPDTEAPHPTHSTVFSKAHTNNNIVTMKGVGIEPTTNGLKGRSGVVDDSRHGRTILPPIIDNCTKSSSLITPIVNTRGHLTGPRYGPFPSDLQKVIDQWHSLPDHIRAAILLLAGGPGAGGEDAR